ncbi:hypothetical protein L2E82_51404 [Cichorium intybus]|nr:hypothetical protein L2E82_51404 [Cichorium intybus]
MLMILILRKQYIRLYNCEIEKLIGDNGTIETIYRKVVNEVDDGSFWCRYFCRIQKLNSKRAGDPLTVDDEED